MSLVVLHLHAPTALTRCLEHGKVMTKLFRLNTALLHLHRQSFVELLVVLGQPIDLDAESGYGLALTNDLLLETVGVGGLNV